MGCAFCHGGDEAGMKKEAAHKGLVKRPSDDLRICGRCHGDIAKRYETSLHYTTAGQRNGVQGRFSAAEFKAFNERVFETSCRSCHASCGDCHVKGPPVGGISIGLVAGHRFVKKDEGKTCAFCHGGRVYPEFTGEYGGSADVHYQKGMMCMDCHKKAEFHGDGNAYPDKQAVKDRPTCRQCHTPGGEKTPMARTAHARHEGKVSCYGCHATGEYRNCSGCHAGQGAAAKPGFILGKNPRNPKELTTLRLVPAVRDMLAPLGIAMTQFDALPNYWNTPAHTIRKRTDRTRSCETCHVEGKYFLTRGKLVEGGASVNRDLIATPKPIQP